jgi:hypothetical protein
MQRFRELGFRVGYFKPIGVGLKEVEGEPRDPDVHLMREILGLIEPLEVITPVTLGRRYLDEMDSCEELERRILKAYEEVSGDKDILLIESPPDPELLICCGLDVPSLARRFKARVIFSVRGVDDEVAERIILYKEFFETRGVELLGAVLNFVPLQQLERMKGVISLVLKRRGIEVLGVVPDKRELTMNTVEELRDILDAEVLAGWDKLDKLVDGYLVGAMTPESALNWLRRSVGCAFITGGDRTDLILTALETMPSVIILTGNIYPSIRVLSTAEERGIPILLVPYDTYSTVMRLEHLDGRITPAPTSKRKIQLIHEMIDEYVNWRDILEGYADWKKMTRWPPPA